MVESKVSRKIQIMQTLAEMLEEKTPVKITTAELARRTNITEAAIYRHFPSKRKIYEEMVVFFESNIFPRIETMKQNQSSDEIPGLIVTLILTFLETNKGFAKIINKQALTAAEAKIDDKISLILEYFLFTISCHFFSNSSPLFPIFLHSSHSMLFNKFLSKLSKISFSPSFNLFW